CRRLVFLTRRGWQVREIILNAVTEVEAEWTSLLGRQRFGQFMNTLRQLSPVQHSERTPSPPGRRPRGARAEEGASDRAARRSSPSTRGRPDAAKSRDPE